MKTPAIALASLALFSGACVTSTTTTRTWSDPAEGSWVRYGRVAQIQETVTEQHGDPAAGAVAGALIGGLLGSMMGGHVHYDRWGYGHYHGSGAGAAVGAVGGAMVGAAASQGSGASRSYAVSVRFDDGGYDTYVYPDDAPFNVGDQVVLTPQGLARP